MRAIARDLGAVRPRDYAALWARMARTGKKAAGRELDGRTWDEFPRTAGTVAA